jgi:alkyl sulfatase BDS1-like metallo-beta-lactamase superfamily hydrolase
VSFAEGDYRWVVEVVNHVVFADPANEPARLLQADALEQLGFQSESGPWRDFYLSGAMELRSNGTVIKGMAGNALGSGIVRSMTPELLLDLIGVRLNGPRSAEFELEVELVIADLGDERWNFGVRHGVLHARRDARGVGSVGVITSIAAFAIFATGSTSFDELLAREDFAVTGEVSALRALVDLLDVFEFGFEIVLP